MVCAREAGLGPQRPFAAAAAADDIYLRVCRNDNILFRTRFLRRRVPTPVRCFTVILFSDRRLEKKNSFVIYCFFFFPLVLSIVVHNQYGMPIYSVRYKRIYDMPRVRKQTMSSIIANVISL